MGNTIEHLHSVASSPISILSDDDTVDRGLFLACGEEEEPGRRDARERECSVGVSLVGEE